MADGASPRRAHVYLSRFAMIHAGRNRVRALRARRLLGSPRPHTYSRPPPCPLPSHLSALACVPEGVCIPARLASSRPTMPPHADWCTRTPSAVGRARNEVHRQSSPSAEGAAVMGACVVLVHEQPPRRDAATSIASRTERAHGTRDSGGDARGGTKRSELAGTRPGPRTSFP